VSSFQLKYSPELDRIVSAAIAKQPEDRYQTGMALASDLQRLRAASGFCDPQIGDWSLRSLKRDAIPRYVSGYQESPSSDAAPTEEQPRFMDCEVASSEAISVSANSKTAQQKRPRFSRSILVFGLLTAALACVAFWSLNRPKSQLGGGVVDPPHSLQGASADAAEDKHREAEPTVPKPSTSRRKVPRPREKVQVGVADKQLPPATTPAAAVPVMAMLRINIQHQFANAVASIWIDNVLVYTQALKGDKSRHALVFQRVVGHQFDTVRVSMGRHKVRVQVQSPPESYDQTKTMAEAFIRDEGTLRIICDKKHDDLLLTIQ
jgi:hypothetical protein